MLILLLRNNFCTRKVVIETKTKTMSQKLLQLFILPALLLCTLSGVSQNKIRVKVNGVANQTVYLANYYGDRLYYNDTTKADAKGYFEFEGKPYEECGKYAIVCPGPKFFDIIVDEEDIYLETDTADFIGNLTVHKSEQNELFFNYLGYIQDKRQQRAPWDKVLADSLATDKKKAMAKAEIQSMNTSVQAYQSKLFAEHPDALFAKLLNMTVETTVPDAPEGVENEQTWKYYYYRDHYWDNVDFKDPRLLRDQIFHKLLDKYWTKVMPQIPDTLLKEAFLLVDRADNYDMKKYFTHYITYAAESSKIMCMDKIFVAMVDRYYKTGKADWLTEEQLVNITERADDMRYSVCGEPVPNIILPDTTLTNWVSLYDIEAKYTVIAIWESSCGHCKKEMPKLQALFDKWHPKGLEMFAIGNDFETEPWLKFVREKEIGNWINVSDNPQINQADSASKLIYSGVTTLQSLNFRKTFDVFSTPKVFLLDADKRVIAKQLSAEQIGELLERLENKGEAVGTMQINEDDGEDDSEDEEYQQEQGKASQENERKKSKSKSN
jgi:thiol-disulfide isomerase/thioredoxin